MFQFTLTHFYLKKKPKKQKKTFYLVCSHLPIPLKCNKNKVNNKQEPTISKTPLLSSTECIFNCDNRRHLELTHMMIYTYP